MRSDLAFCDYSTACAIFLEFSQDMTVYLKLSLGVVFASAANELLESLKLNSAKKAVKAENEQQ
jgi:hypothetical protein